MADKHPYLSGSAALFQIIEHLRKSFPPSGVSADTLKKLGLASNNETYVINVLRFIDVIDEDGKKTAAAAKIFTQHDDEKFSEGFEGLVKKAYSELFSLHGDDAWTLDRDPLIQYFRSSDETSAIVGKRQATVFQALSAIAGHGEAPASRRPAKKKAAKKGAPKKAKKRTSAATTSTDVEKPDVSRVDNGSGLAREVGLTVRIEVNLPPDGDKETYDWYLPEHPRELH